MSVLFFEYGCDDTEPTINSLGSDTDYPASNLQDRSKHFYWKAGNANTAGSIDFDTFLNASAVITNDVIEFDDSVMDDYLKLFGRSWSGVKFVVLNVQRRGNQKFNIVAEELTSSFL